MHTETFGEQIRRLRKKQGLSLRELAAALDYDQSSLSKVERNALPAPPPIIKPLAKALGVSYEKLIISFQSEQVYYLLKEADFALESLEVARKRLEKEDTGTIRDLHRSRLLQRIRDYLQEQPIEKAWIFGSFARREESRDSDLDLMVRFTTPHKVDILDFVEMKQQLESLVERQVDLVEEGQVYPAIAERANREKMLIYERKAG